MVSPVYACTYRARARAVAWAVKRAARAAKTTQGTEPPAAASTARPASSGCARARAEPSRLSAAATAIQRR